MSSKQKIKEELFAIVIGALILCFYALNNKFPLLFEKSGNFIDNGFSEKKHTTGESLYSFFVAHASWGKSLWFVVYSQSVLLILVLYYYFHFFIENHRSRLIYYYGYIFFISFLMSASIAASTISPIIFGSTSLLSIGLLFFVKHLNFERTLIISVIAIVSSAMDTATILTMALIFVASPVIYLFIKGEQRVNWRTLFSRFAIVGMFSIALFLSVNKVTGKSETGFQWNNWHAGLRNLTVEFKSISIPKFKKPTVEGPAITAVENWFTSDIRECYLSKQIAGAETFDMIRMSQWMVLLLTTCACIYLLIKTKFHNNLILYLLASLLLTFIVRSGVSGKLEDGLWGFVWILPLPLFLFPVLPNHNLNEK
ncbi:hypothetical protein LX99_05066 [Mucilaginibacter oryzae]|uniref:Dolichyl-phosphate-mannose-protein mannosyltransferase n=1 Tax=Mucilaginibacter oryzae TaxID=468058 RepID=A0A316GR78_9SPHI|nr:hypothetical protein [Mucilaginibacter oryzae]PWK64902.1 hypothetical protein LX99_05066 [Mucilaginibacter oryzae]